MLRENYLIKDASELRKMILENPDLPIVVLADGETSCQGEGMWWYQSDVRCSKGLILDYDLEWTDKTYTDEDDFEEDLEEYIYDKYFDELGEKELEELFAKKKNTYESYWREVIQVWVSN